MGAGCVTKVGAGCFTKVGAGCVTRVGAGCVTRVGAGCVTKVVTVFSTKDMFALDSVRKCAPMIRCCDISATIALIEISKPAMLIFMLQ